MVVDIGSYPYGYIDRNHLRHIQEKEDVLEKLMKLFEIPKIIHIFARLFDQGALILS